MTLTANDFQSVKMGFQVFRPKKKKKSGVEMDIGAFQPN